MRYCVRVLEDLMYKIEKLSYMYDAMRCYAMQWRALN
jgi:hypothetical protein